MNKAYDSWDVRDSFVSALIVPRKSLLAIRLRNINNPSLSSIRIIVVEEETLLTRPEWVEPHSCRWKCDLPGLGALAFFGDRDDLPAAANGPAELRFYLYPPDTATPFYDVPGAKGLVGYQTWVRPLTSPTDIIEFLVEESEGALSQ